MIAVKGSSAIRNSFSALDNGTIGEYICALRLLKMGIPCRIVNMGTTDIIAEFDNKMYRIQAKASQRKLRHTNPNNYGYQFMTAKGGKKLPFTVDDCDIVACVTIDTEQIWFFPVHKLINQVSKRIQPEKFDEHTTERTWKDTIAYLETL